MAATWRQSVGAGLARLRRGLARMWRRIAPPRDGWGAPPRDEAHALYRERFERFVEGLPALPRIRTNQTSEAFLAFSQTVQMLHEYGDDPIMPPGVKRIVRAHERLAAFGAVGQPSGFLGPVGGVLGGWKVWALAGGIALSGWGVAAVQGARLNAEEARHDNTRADLAEAERRVIEAQETQRVLANALREADAQSQEAAAMIERERARRLRAERDQRRVRDAVDQARAGGPIDYGFGGVRDAGPAPAGPRDDRPAAANPGPVSR